MMTLWVSLILGLQPASQSQTEMWQAIARLELVIQDKVNALETHGMVLPSDPVRGYYFHGQGLIFFVPLRYRTQEVRTIDLEFPNSAKVMKSKEESRAQSISWNQQIRDWKNQVRQREAMKDAAFDKILQALSNGLPELITLLPALPAGESFTLVVEEREPAFVFGSFGPSAQFKRKISTLEVQSRYLSAIAEESADGEVIRSYVTRSTEERPANLGFQSNQSRAWQKTGRKGMK